MKAFGADLYIVPSVGGQVTPDLVPRMIEKAKSLSEVDGCYFTDQLYNTDSIVGYRTLGKEILQQIDQQIDAFCGGVGTAGMLMGVSQELRHTHQAVRIVALEPASSQVAVPVHTMLKGQALVLSPRCWMRNSSTKPVGLTKMKREKWHVCSRRKKVFLPVRRVA
jgi:cysteine synthase